MPMRNSGPDSVLLNIPLYNVCISGRQSLKGDLTVTAHGHILIEVP